MRRKASFHFIRIIWTKNFNQNIFITVDLMFLLKVLTINKKKIYNVNVSNCAVDIVKFSFDLIPCFWPIFVDFQNETASLCVNN